MTTMSHKLALELLHAGGCFSPAMITLTLALKLIPFPAMPGSPACPGT